MKYFFILMVASAGILFASMFGTVYFMGNTIQAANIGLLLGLCLGGGTFILGWILLYVAFQQKNIPYHHFMLVIRLSRLRLENVQETNFIWFPHFKVKTFTTEDKDQETGKPTGWRNKTFQLMEPEEFNPGYRDFGVIREFTIHYYGEWSKLVNMQPGTTQYKDMEIPCGNIDVLTVEPVIYADLNVKHGAHSPIFKLLSGGFEGCYSNPEATVPNPNTHMIQTVSGKSTALSVADSNELETLRVRARDLETALLERNRQSEEDKAHAIKEERQHLLDAGELEGIKDISGEMKNIIVANMQHIVAAMNSWYGGLAWLQRNDQTWENKYMPYILLGIVFFGILAFFGLQPNLTNQAAAALQSPLVLGTILTVVIVGFVVFYYIVIKRRRRKK